MNEKFCKYCDTNKPRSDFRKRRDSKDGLTGRCYLCLAGNRLKFKDKTKARNREYYLAKKDILLPRNAEYQKKWLALNSANPEFRKKRCEKTLRWQKQNPYKVKALNAARRAQRIKATPKWANKEKINMIYENCPIGYEVDHIVPLKGKNVSGLHVENNLQYLTAQQNSKKNNKFEV